MSTDKALLSRIKDSNYARWSIRMRFDEGHSIRDLFRVQEGSSCQTRQGVRLRKGVWRKLL